ncbi:glutathione S-transferase family protein [Novosphingobium piscinae]|uniref:Glutathione S-transferase family protein n=1 Tax=Novosphingobium piscinae TaxID=1507448 RepID=A0A7X1FY07_9SPHN|nr:glutathione S-transferase family protein [Novosphingobium piscinae]MBC2669111.1 glutathione S-transferase family protein [Novosphingobium piscinae]
MKLIIGNRVYSSWSLRGWLACKQSGLPFVEEVVPLYGEGWEERRAQGLLAPSHGRVPLLWDGETVVWDSLAILDSLADRVGADRFWPRPPAARALARAMVAEMHAGFAALRQQCPMNMRRRYADFQPDAAVRADVVRILTLWAEARARFGAGGPFLFGSFSAADIFYAPVVSRFITYGITVPGFAQAYMDAVWEHPWLQQWAAAAAAEPWIIAAFERKD